MRFAFRQYTRELNNNWGRASVLLLAILCAAKTEAATYYVSTNGSDSNSCVAAQSATESNQKRTVAAGVACATTPGDAVYVHGGTYTGPEATIDSQGQAVASGSSSLPITISGYPGQTAVLQPAYNVSGIRLTTPVSYLIIQDLTIDMAASTYPATAEGVMLYTAHHIRLQRLDIKNGPSFGVHSGDNTPYIEILNSKIHNFRHPGSVAGDNHGMYMTGSDALYDGNEIYDNDGYGLHIYNNRGSNADPSRTITRNNKVHNNGVHGSSEYGIIVAWGSDNVVYNNVVYNNPGGIQVYSASANALVYNNTVYDNKPDAGIAMQYYRTAPTVRNNIAYSNGTNIADYGGSGTPTIDHNLTTDPGFTNAAAGDFTLRPGSAAVDAGVALAIVTTDFAYRPRPQGAAYDIGAFEGAGSSTAPSVPRNVKAFLQ